VPPVPGQPVPGLPASPTGDARLIAVYYDLGPASRVHPHPPSHLSVAGNQRRRDGGLSGLLAHARVLDAARRTHDLIVIDTPRHLDDAARTPWPSPTTPCWSPPTSSARLWPPDRQRRRSPLTASIFGWGSAPPKPGSSPPLRSSTASTYSWPASSAANPPRATHRTRRHVHQRPRPAGRVVPQADQRPLPEDPPPHRAEP
jgi:hypothetical protein